MAHPTWAGLLRSLAGGMAGKSRKPMADSSVSRKTFLFDTESANSADCRSDPQSVVLAGLQPGLVFCVDFYCHDPPMLADLAVPNETQRLVGGQCSVVEEASGHCRGIFRVSLDRAAAPLGN